MNYNFSRYRWLIEQMNKSGREYATFEGDLNNSILLRIDVDFEPMWAMKLAEINNSMNVKANFFFQVSNTMYNLFALSTQHILKRIVSLGQQIGLHYYQKGPIVISEQIEYEFSLLNSIVETVSKVIAWHNYSGDYNIINKQAIDCGFICTYDQKFFEKNRYISDSNFKHTLKDITNFVLNCKETNIQVLLHPIYWISDYSSLNEVLEKTFCYKIKLLCDNFSENTVWKNEYSQKVLNHIDSIFNEE